MVRTKTFILGAITLVALSLLSEPGYSLERRKKKHAKDTTEVSKPDTYGDLVKKAKITEGMVKILTVGNDYYFEVADSLMGRDLLIVNKVSGVPYELNDAGLNRGMESNDKLVRFYKDKSMNKVWVTTYNGKVSVPEEDAISESVKANYRESVIEYFPIEAYGKDSTSVVFKVNKIFDGSEKSFNDIYNEIALGGSVKKDLSKILGVKVFPKNVVVKALMTTQVVDGGVAVPLTVETTTNLVLLPKVPMKPRFADPRVGFFATEHIYFTDEQQQVEKREFVHRWRLEPKPEDVEKYKRGEVVEPVKPIVFYIDRNTPKFLQPYFVEAVNLWQPVFEKIGFKNAIIGKMAPTLEEDPDFSMEDVRYSVISYKASLVPNAYGPHMADPRSGEILCSHIGIFHNVMEMVQQWYFCQAAASDPRVRQCPMPENVVGDVMRFVVAHEVGHTLGLRHNFGASSLFPVEKLRDKEYVKKHGHTASIMDYARMNYIAQPEDHIDVKDLIPRIGIYDEFAIEWGYRYFPGMELKEETEYLRNWVTQKYKEDPRYMFGTELDMSDPRFQSEDLGDNSMKASEYGIKNLKLIMSNLETWTKGDDDDATYLKMMYNGVLNQYMYFISHVLKNVGGRYSEMPLRSNGKAESRMVEKERQQEAMEFLTRHVFTSPEWLFEKRIISLAGIDKLKTQGNIQRFVIQNLLPKTAFLSSCMDLYGREGNYTPEDYFNDLENGVFADLKNGEALPAYRRDLQMEYLRQVMAITRYSEVRKTANLLTMFVLQLENIVKAAEAYKMKAPDKASEMHAETIVKTVEAWLNGEKNGLYLK